MDEVHAHPPPKRFGSAFRTTYNNVGSLRRAAKLQPRGVVAPG